MAKYRTMLELDKIHKVLNSASANKYHTVKNRLQENGFGSDMRDLPSFLANNPKFLEDCNTVQEGICAHNAVVVLIDSMGLLWNIHKYFPILYALNNLGNSVFRTTIKLLLDGLLDRDSIEFERRLSQNLVVISNMFGGDNRLASFASSIEGLVIPIMFRKKIIFTAHTTETSFNSAIDNATLKLNNLYSPSLAQAFVEHTYPIFLQTRASKESYWKHHQ